MCMWQGIEARLRQPVQAVNPDLTLPPDIAARVSAPAGSAEAAYGQHREGDTSSKVRLIWPTGCARAVVAPAGCPFICS